MGTQLSAALRSASWLAPAAIIALAIIVVTLALIGLRPTTSAAGAGRSAAGSRERQPRAPATPSPGRDPAREVDRDDREQDGDDARDVDDRDLVGQAEALEDPDGQRLDAASHEERDDDLVERQCEGQQRAGQQRCPDGRERDVAERLEGVCAEVS